MTIKSAAETYKARRQKEVELRERIGIKVKNRPKWKPSEQMKKLQDESRELLPKDSPEQLVAVMTSYGSGGDGLRPCDGILSTLVSETTIYTRFFGFEHDTRDNHRLAAFDLARSRTFLFSDSFQTAKVSITQVEVSTVNYVHTFKRRGRWVAGDE